MAIVPINARMLTDIAITTARNRGHISPDAEILGTYAAFVAGNAIEERNRSIFRAFKKSPQNIAIDTIDHIIPRIHP